ncbi:MAG: DUF6035 family protein [Pseudomonadota bacterium]
MKNKAGNSQQSVLLALDTDSGKLIESRALLVMDEESLRSLRRSSLTEGTPRLRCALCEGPVHVSMRRTEAGNRWFAHHGKVTICPYRTDRRMSPDELFAWQYQGQQEGSEHKYLKHFIADWVEREPDINPDSVWRDKVRPSDLKRGEWKRPDVRAVIGGREIVFEIQLSYTFLSEVLRRDAFYQQEQIHILWIFRDFQPHREVVRDEFFHNRRNIFVLDADSEQETIKRGRLTLKCYYQTPTLTGESISERWGTRYVHLNELNYPIPEYRPYYRDFDNARLHLLRLSLIRSVMRWGRTRKKRGGDVDEAFARVVAAWRALESTATKVWPEYFSETDFLCEQLPRLLSIKRGRPVGYNYKTVWEVLNAALLIPSKSARPYDILYLMAVKQYRPPLSADHQKKIDKHGEDVKQSIDAGEPRFLRDQRYDQAISVVLPELLPRLDSTYGVREEHS